MEYVISVRDRNYEEWFLNIANEQFSNPIQSKLFNDDTFTFNDDKAIIVKSPTRHMINIPGVLVLSNDRTYGKHKRKSLYRCVPNDSTLPEFLVPYSPYVKFKKKMVNKYVVFKYVHWEDKHPRGQIQTTLGDVTELPNFYEYQLYCRGVHDTISKMNKKTKGVFKLRGDTEQSNEQRYMENIMNKYDIENRVGWDIVTIDSCGAKDLDDAIGYKVLDNGDYLISVYITNIVLWFEELDLWEAFETRVSTIYLPDRKRPMLSTILSDSIGSLLENKNRYTFTLDIVVDHLSGEIREYSFKNTLINVSNNMRHETIGVSYYKMLKKIALLMNTKQIYLESIVNSSEVVSYYMILMNYLSSVKLCKFKDGIFRFAKGSAEDTSHNESK